jgi:hypothetical protein
MLKKTEGHHARATGHENRAYSNNWRSELPLPEQHVIVIQFWPVRWTGAAGSFHLSRKV